MQLYEGLAELLKLYTSCVGTMMVTQHHPPWSTVKGLNDFGSEELAMTAWSGAKVRGSALRSFQLPALTPSSWRSSQNVCLDAFG